MKRLLLASCTLLALAACTPSATHSQNQKDTPNANNSTSGAPEGMDKPMAQQENGTAPVSGSSAQPSGAPNAMGSAAPTTEGSMQGAGTTGTTTQTGK